MPLLSYLVLDLHHETSGIFFFQPFKGSFGEKKPRVISRMRTGGHVSRLEHDEQDLEWGF